MVEASSYPLRCSDHGALAGGEILRRTLDDEEEEEVRDRSTMHLVNSSRYRAWISMLIVFAFNHIIDVCKRSQPHGETSLVVEVSTY